MKPIGFIEGLCRTADAQPDSPAIELIDGPERGQSLWTYAQLRALVERYRAAFVALGMRADEPVLLRLPSGPDLIAAVYALTSLDAIFAPVSPKLTSQELSCILDDLQPVGVVAGPEFFNEYPDVRAGGSRGVRLALVPEELPEGCSPLEPPSGNPLISCHYTYKGLGYPLGALHRYDDYGYCIAAMDDTFREARGGTHLVGLPIYPIYGLTAGVLGPLATGGRILMTHRIFEIDLVELLDRYQVNFTCMVPMLLKKLASRARRRVEQGLTAHLHPGLEIISGGSYLDAETAAEVRAALGLEVYQGYGLTETLPIAGTRRGGNKPGSLGLPFSDDIEIAIVDAEGRHVAPGEAGEIAVKSPTLLHAFRGKPAETNRFLKQGWFHTGDLGFQDADGYLHFLGRSCAITKVASQMADLVEVELALRTHPAVADVRVTVAVRPEIGESLMASVILHDGAQITERELKTACKKMLSAHKTPREFKICPRRAVENN